MKKRIQVFYPAAGLVLAVGMLVLLALRRDVLEGRELAVMPVHLPPHSPQDDLVARSVPARSVGVAHLRLAPAPPKDSSLVSVREQPLLAEELAAIEADYREMAGAVLERSDAVIASADRLLLGRLDTERARDLAALLSSDERELYSNQSDPTSAPRRR